MKSGGLGLADNSYLDDGTGFALVNGITAKNKVLSNEFDDDTKLNMTNNPEEEESDDALDSSFEKFSEDA